MLDRQLFFLIYNASGSTSRERKILNICIGEGPFRWDGWFVFFEAAPRMPGIRYDAAPEDLNKKRGGIKK
jgi:hypothetical protein